MGVDLFKFEKGDEIGWFEVKENIKPLEFDNLKNVYT